MSVPLIVAGAGIYALKMLQIPEYIDSRFEKRSPSFIVLATVVTMVALAVLVKYCKKGWGNTWREQTGNLALRVSHVKKKFDAEFSKNLDHFKESSLKKWAAFEPLAFTLPKKGLSGDELAALVTRYSNITSEGLKDKYFSGTIYTKSSDQERQTVNDHKGPEKLESSKKEELAAESDLEYFNRLSKKLEKSFSMAFEKSYLWNSLHADQFAIGPCIDYQVVRIVASMFGGAVNEVMGFVTSGGTESLMLAIRAYREWGKDKRGLQPGEGVILASKSVHAAVIKGGQASQVKVDLIDTDEKGKISLKHLREAFKKHGNNVIAIFGSAPTYPEGVVDPIEEMASIAMKNGCGMHVDCCLGAFVINNLPNIRSDFLKIPGVTSLSADTHKNGFAPKGSSVLVTKKLGEHNLAYYSIYTLPGWRGGVYGTPKDAGSQSVVNSFNALLALLGTGQEGYEYSSKLICGCTKKLAAIIKRYEGQLKLLYEPEVNVVTFKIDEAWGLQKGATYAFAHEMAKKNIILNTISDDRAHFCVTVRFASDPSGLEKFNMAIEECLKATKKLNDTLVSQGEKFSGDAGMYCALEAALEPKKQELSTRKYIENMLLGELGAKDAVRAYFLAQLDPFPQA